ncbi:MAG TPA: ImmA/IrrE family metallo-endopeptidase [Anaerolineaceae bacterium]|nr:ImmA/IrrE family metallo-endopeptidase [Anaerolineaceae bacterium]HPN52271.1 ImmA/IrrE family metallo-endopeptidase [Anaerolineaceae bacterium]
MLNKKRPLSLTMIRALHKGLDIPAEVLMQEPGGQLDSIKYEISDRLFAEMFRAGYFTFFTGNLKLAKEKMEEILLQFFGPFQNQQAQRVYCRQSPKARLDSVQCVAEAPVNYDAGDSEESAASKKQVDDKALEAWHIRALTLADEQEKTLQDYAHGKITHEFMRDVIKLSTFDNGPLLARQKLADYGIPLVILPHLAHTYLDGACFLTSSGRAVVGMTLRHDRLDNFWFTLAHELAHVYLHLHSDSNQAFFDDTESGAEATESQYETEANQLTWKLLIPEEMWAQKIQPHLSRLTRIQIIDFSKSIFVSPAIVAGRVRWHTGDFNHFSDLVGHGKVAHLFVKTKENHEPVA